MSLAPMMLKWMLSNIAITTAKRYLNSTNKPKFNFNQKKVQINGTINSNLTIKSSLKIAIPQQTRMEIKAKR
jgi:hypothetical protein